MFCSTVAFGHPLVFVLAVVLVDYGPRLAVGIPSSQQCRNPLFEIHWFISAGMNPPLLGDTPASRTNLRLCPVYNGQPSCCVESFESEQMLHFNYWKEIFGAKIEGIREDLVGIERVKDTDAFNAASDAARAQFYRALDAHERMLDPANHASCFTALMTYVAGMICFSCDPSWLSMVQLDTGKIVRILLTGNTCHVVWEACASFGAMAAQLSQLMLDSRLVAMQGSPVEDVEMFLGQQALCDWMHNSVAMKPFTTPPEAQREAAPALEVIRAGRRMATAMHAPTLTGGGTSEYDAMKAGRASGFDTLWEGALAPSGSAAPRQLGLAAAACVFAACSSRHGGPGG